MIEVSVDASVGRELASLSRKLKAASRELPKDMRKSLRKAASPALAKGRAAARDLPSRSAGQRRDSQGRFARDVRPSLRREIARVMRTQITTRGGETSLRIGVPKKPLGTRGRLPQLMNRGVWRHPVYGSDRWVDQRSRPGWFDNVMRTEAPQVGRSIEAVLDEFEKRV